MQQSSTAGIKTRVSAVSARTLFEIVSKAFRSVAFLKEGNRRDYLQLLLPLASTSLVRLASNVDVVGKASSKLL